MVKNVGSLIYTHFPTDSSKGYYSTEIQYLRFVGLYANTVYKRAVHGCEICQKQFLAREFYGGMLPGNKILDSAKTKEILVTKTEGI